MENVREVMAEVGNWWEVGGELGIRLFKRQEIYEQSSTEREASLALGDYWVNTDPDASWEDLARALYLSGEERALAVTKQYLQQGECTQLPVMKVPVKILVQCISPVSHQIVFIQTQGVCDHMYMYVDHYSLPLHLVSAAIVLMLILMEHLILIPLFISAHINFQYPEIVPLKRLAHGQERLSYQYEIMMVLYTFNP